MQLAQRAGTQATDAKRGKTCDKCEESRLHQITVTWSLFVPVMTRQHLCSDELETGNTIVPIQMLKNVSGLSISSPSYQPVV